ncbi:MAG: dockerin type I repeat-containing protein [Muribaculaceae bacterium]|nr:dockerin type I repeat-containing protein [Muribaculaceae bacterium]
MKKFITLCFLASAVLAQAKVYTLADLVDVVGTMENSYEKNGETITETIGITVDDDNVYTIMLPTGLAADVSGIGFDDNNIILTKKYFTITEGNDLAINEGETLQFAGAAMLEMLGTLTATTATFKPAEGAEGTAQGFRMYGDNADATFTDCIFNKLGINFGSSNGNLVMDGCTFLEHNGKSGNSAVNFTSSCNGNEITNCTFTNCALSGVASGANTGVGIIIKDCEFLHENVVTRLYPHINLTLDSNREIIIDSNKVIGSKQTNRSGGIAISNLLGGTYTGAVYVCNNYVEGNSYGITLTGQGNIYIENNKVIDNKYIASAASGGSGINITCSTEGVLAKAYIKGNLIKDNLWGITAYSVKNGVPIGSVEINAGKGSDPEAEDYNPGGNVFINNGNGGVLYDFYNNTSLDNYAQGNTWNVEVQDEEHIEAVVVHKNDDENLGTLFFMPPAASTVGDLNGDGVVDIADVNICINIILELNNDPELKELADLNGDGVVDVADVNAIINIILAN